MIKSEGHNPETCRGPINSVKDALYVLSGKWKLLLMVALAEGPMRFKDIQRSLVDITPKMLSKELRELELNDMVERKVFNTVPVTITYELTEYSDTVQPVIEALKVWGEQHRERLVKGRRTEPVEAEVLT
jgi:DNA-binding HxlR family transcriptional regulator